MVVDLLAPREWRVTHVHSNYEVSDCGQVRNRTTGHVLKLSLSGARNTKGYRPYFRVGFYSSSWGRSTRTFSVHQLVCRAFNGPPPTPLHEVAHGNGDKRDNRADNLRWATHTENQADMREYGTYVPPPGLRGESHNKAKLNYVAAQQVREMAASGMTQREIGKAMGVRHSTVGCVLRGQTWRHVT